MQGSLPELIYWLQKILHSRNTNGTAGECGTAYLLWGSAGGALSTWGDHGGLKEDALEHDRSAMNLRSAPTPPAPPPGSCNQHNLTCQ